LAEGVPLADLDLLEDLSGAERAALEARLRPLRAEAGDTVMHEGDAGDRFVLIVEGQAVVTRHGAEVGTVGPGSIVGELAVLRGTPRSATVTAVSPIVGMTGDADAFAALAEAPGVRERLGRAAGQRLVMSARAVHVTLADGTPLQIRPILPADRPRLEEAIAKHFGLESTRKRFFSPGHPSPALISYLVDVDYVDHFAWVFLTEEDGVLRGTASGRYIRLHDAPDTAELALGVTDDYQGRGLGRLLLGALGAAAPNGGITRFRASVLADNKPMRALLDRAGARWTFEEPGVVAATVAVEDARVLLPPNLESALGATAGDIIAAAGLALA
jgi:CRP-like cAMP-binding protein/GNAT superfamily N-acetyltransferase